MSTAPRDGQRIQPRQTRPLLPDERNQFAERWESVEVRFADDPTGAVVEADRLAEEIMQARGYPTGDPWERAVDIWVQRPYLVVNYRAARALTDRSEHGAAKDGPDLRVEYDGFNPSSADRVIRFNVTNVGKADSTPTTLHIEDELDFCAASALGPTPRMPPSGSQGTSGAAPNSTRRTTTRRTPLRPAHPRGRPASRSRPTHRRWSSGRPRTTGRMTAR